jgi:hypothetical protein
MEAEAKGVRFTIDHYEPVSARPELETDYSNLMWACDPCNGRKGDMSPPPEARARGHRFYRPDEDVYSDHFALAGKRLEGKSLTGEYTILALALNRLMLLRLRDIRLGLISSESYVAQGIAGLRDFPIDRLPKDIRGKVFTAIRGFAKDAEALSKAVDEILREEAKSVLLDDDPNPSVTKEEDNARKQRIKKLEASCGGNWRGRFERGGDG